MNACNSATGSFATAFGVDNELFLGWDNALYYTESTYFGFEWWKFMVLGSTASFAATAVDLGTGLFTRDDVFTDHAKIKISNPNFRLW